MSEQIAKQKVRIFVVVHSTQLLIIQHIRTNGALPKAREFVVWQTVGDPPGQQEFMQSIISTAGFDGDLNVRDFLLMRTRTSGALRWVFDSVRSYILDARKVRQWMRRNNIDANDVELWVDDPIHLPTVFMLGALPAARRIKFPHAFNYDEDYSPDLKDKVLRPWRNPTWIRRFFQWPLIRLLAGVDLRIARLRYDAGYTFHAPSCWSQESRDISALVSADALRATFLSLPREVREEFNQLEKQLEYAQRPLIVLLLFGLDAHPALRPAYEASVTRILKERRDEIADGSLIVKIHPSARGIEEEKFFSWLKENVRQPIFITKMRLNFEFMGALVRPDYVLAGPCGALPLVQRLATGKPIVLREVMDLFADEPTVAKLVEGMEVW